MNAPERGEKGGSKSKGFCCHRYKIRRGKKELEAKRETHGSYGKHRRQSADMEGLSLSTKPKKERTKKLTPKSGGADELHSRLEREKGAGRKSYDGVN